MSKFRKPTPSNGRTGVFIGRFQAPGAMHDGHVACVEAILEECQRVIIFVRDTPQDERNPLTFHERAHKIRERFPDTRRVMIMQLPDYGCNLGVYYGREVGYDIERIELDEQTEAISATKLRAAAEEESD